MSIELLRMLRVVDAAIANHGLCCASCLVASCITGDPLSGPSAVDAVVAGCAYLNPVYSKPMMDIYNSQHPFLEQRVGEPYVCSFGQQVSPLLSIYYIVNTVVENIVAAVLPKYTEAL